MSKRLIFWGLSVLLIAAFAGVAVADVPQGNHDGISVWDHIAAKAAPAPAEAIAIDPATVNTERADVADLGCQALINSCEIPFYIWSIPNHGNTRTMAGEGYTPDPGFSATPCTLISVDVLIYDWQDTAVATHTDARVNIHADDGFGLPGAVIATRLIAEATIDANLFAYINVDFSADNLVIPAGDKFHVIINAEKGGVAAVVGDGTGFFLLSDGGTDDAAACPVGAANMNSEVFYESVGFWETAATHFGGFTFGFFLAANVCCEAPPPDCFSLINTCEIPFYIWSIPNHANTRSAAGEGYNLDPTGSRECTLKTAYVLIYDWQDTAVATHTDADITVHADDGFGLPGAALATVTIPEATIDANLFSYIPVDFSSFNLTAPAGGRLHVIVTASKGGVPSVVGDGTGFFLLSDGGTDDAAACPVGAANTNSEVFYDNVGFWERAVDHFGGFTFGFFMSIDVCCPPLLFSLCTPASDLDWATQGNGYSRTNATTASLSSLCGITQSWTAEPGGAVQAIQPIIADGKVIVSATDSVHCYDKVTGAQIWAVGGFPYIIGDLRGSPTVEGAFVYFGGSGAQAFTCVDLATGAVVWSRNLGGGGDIPLLAGQTNWTPSVVAGGVVYFTQETGNLYALDITTGADVGASPLALPDAPGATPVNGLTSDGTKLWIGTADAVGTAGSIHQVDMAALTIDWTLTGPGNIFYPGGVGDPSFDPFSPEGHPGSMGYEDGILYYHSQIRNDGNGFLHFPQTGAVGAIDVAAEDGTGAGILWVNDANVLTVASPGLTPTGSYDFSGPAVGPGLLYLTSRGFFGGTTEQDGVSAWDKTLGTRLWYDGYKNIGVSGGVGVLDDGRCDAPATVFCQPDGTPYVFTGHVGGDFRLYNGNTGAIEWQRTMSERTRGIAVADDCVATVVRTGGPLTGGGSVVVFAVGVDRPRLQIDSQFVFRTATPGDGVTNDLVADAIQNTGCVDLNVSSYTEINPPAVRISSVHPALAAATRRATRDLGGYDAMLDAYSQKSVQIMRWAGVEEDVETSELVRTFANAVGSASDPLFLTVNTPAGAISGGATQSLDVDYDETGLSNNTSYTNFIEIASDDPDYYPQDPTGAVYGDPAITFELFIGCPDAEAVMNTGLGEIWVNNFGAGAGAGNFGDPGPQNFNINGNTANMFDGGWAMVVQDSLHWAFDGCSVGGYPRRAGEWGPTLPCGITIVASAYDSPLGAGADAVEEVRHLMLDLASTSGFFAAGSRTVGGVEMDVQRVASQDAAFGDFVLTAITVTNEVGDPGDISGALNDVYFGGVTDWDISGGDNLTAYADGYAQEDGGAGGPGNGSWICGHVRLDGDAWGAGPIGSGGSPTFMSADIQNDQGHGEAAYRMMNDPAGYGASVDPASTDNTDLAALWTIWQTASIADGASETFYHAIYQVENGVNGIPWSNAAEADAAYAEVTCRAKAFAGFGKGDVTCDGVIDLQDVVALGNIIDGLLVPSGGAVYTADVQGDNDWDEDDYTELYDYVAGLGAITGNSWRF